MAHCVVESDLHKLSKGFGPGMRDSSFTRSARLKRRKTLKSKELFLERRENPADFSRAHLK